MDANYFDAIKIGLASPEQIRNWSSGEVKKPETINYRTLKPEREGLFCEKIFGPVKDWECHCGKYKRVRYKGVVCDRCGVEVTRSKVRRERMGHIELAAPVSHIWYFKTLPSRMGRLLDMSPRSLEKVLYFVSYIVLDPKDTPLMKKQLLSENEYMDAVDKYGYDGFKAEMGAQAIKELLQEIDLEALNKELRQELKEASGQRRSRAISRLEVVESFRKSPNKPEWMILDVLPVIPPELRPMVQLEGGRFATSDLNDLYRRVINRNNRLRRLIDLGAPDIIVRNEKRMLQEAVDALIDNGRRGRAVAGPGNRPLKSLSDMLKGKQGRFRQNLLGKRVDYSGRSVIVVGPYLKMNQCGLPREMALELFKPFVMKKLVAMEKAGNIKNAKKKVEKQSEEVWEILEDVIKEHPVMLNRAPTLHRLGIQAFDPILVNGRALQLHPLVCTAYNADFDGDQMAVHLPLSAEAQAEARVLMLAANNILSPANGKPISTPTQDMVLGCYYLTCAREGAKGEGMVFKDLDEAMLAYDTGVLSLQAMIRIRPYGKKVLAEEGSSLAKTTLGRLIFNEALPPEMHFIDYLVDKKKLGKILDQCFRLFGTSITSKTLDKIKNLGFKYSTRAGMTVAVSDIKVPEKKKLLLDDAEKAVGKIEHQFRRGLITEEERYDKVIAIWTKANDDVKDAMLENFNELNPIYMMAISGARGNIKQISQLAGMRGLMADPSGKIIDVPIKSNFREGLSVLEYFISTHGARKGLADTALRTADSGYLTRRLVDVAQDVMVREIDCGTHEGIKVASLYKGNQLVENLIDRIIGRVTSEDIIDPRTGEVLIAYDEEITDAKADMIKKINQEIEQDIENGKDDIQPIKEVKIRSVLTCEAKHGVCTRCYGRNLATGKMVEVGESVGIIAAQSIGEPGTQLTMRTFHTGGVAGNDITQGLPRVEEIFEARAPKGQAIISECDGRVSLQEHKNQREIVITGDMETKEYLTPYGSRILVQDGDYVQAGDQLTGGSQNPHDILKIKGAEGVQQYLIQGVQEVYQSQGVEINDKHIEVIVRQMLRKIKVEEPGDTSMLPGDMIDRFTFVEENKKIVAEGGEPAQGKPALLGITKAALATDSFLSAASFQETTKILTDAAIKGKSDHLLGLKENVIIGKLVPAGTGMPYYHDLEVKDERVEEEVAKHKEIQPDVEETEEVTE